MISRYVRWQAVGRYATSATSSRIRVNVLNPRSRTIRSLTFSGRFRGFPWAVYCGGRCSSAQADAGRSSAIALRLGMASMPKRNVTSSASQASSCLVWVKSVSPRR